MEKKATEGTDGGSSCFRSRSRSTLDEKSPRETWESLLSKEYTLRKKGGTENKNKNAITVQKHSRRVR